MATAVLLIAQLTAAASLTDLERQRLVAHLEMTSAWLADEVSDLTPAQLDFRPSPEAWTIMQVLEHLVIVGPIYWQDLQNALRSPATGHIVERQGCDGYQWALLISTHEQRHVLQIREIKAHPRFPKK